MKYIKIPETVKVTHLANNKPIVDPEGNQITVSFKDFIIDRLSEDGVFGKDGAAIRSQMKIIAAVDKADGYLQLEDEDYTRLMKAVDSPSKPYNATIARCFWEPFHSALTHESIEVEPADEDKPANGKVVKQKRAN